MPEGGQGKRSAYAGQSLTTAQGASRRQASFREGALFQPPTGSFTRMDVPTARPSDASVISVRPARSPSGISPSQFGSMLYSGELQQTLGMSESTRAVRGYRTAGLGYKSVATA